MREDQELRVRVARADPLEAVLFSILGLVNDWLKFAEAKNGGVVGLASAAIALLLGYVSETPSLPAQARVSLALGSACLLGSLIVGLGSFFPRTNLPGLLAGHRGEPGGSDNLYYFGHIAKYSPSHLAEAVGRRYLSGKGEAVGEGHHDLAAQAVTNARITVWKLRMFGVAVALFGAGVVIAALGVGLASLA